MKLSIGIESLADLKKQRLLLLTVCAVVLAVLVVHLIWLGPLTEEKAGSNQQISQQEEVIRKYQQKLAQAQSIRDDLAKQEQELKEMQKRLFRGNDPYQLAAHLGELLSSKTNPKDKIDMKTYQVVSSKEFGLYQEVHLRYNFMTTVEGLYFFLNRIRNVQTTVLVHEINIQRIQRKTGPDLVVNVILAALMEKGEKS